jgi:hypothetical protein
MTQEAVDAGLSSPSIAVRINALLSAAYFIDDWRWTQDRCLDALSSPDSDPDFQNVAILCLGHIARIHSALDTDKVIPVLKALVSNEQLGSEASQTLDDIKWFLAHPGE